MNLSPFVLARLRLFLLALAWCSLGQAAWAQRVGFVNPGRHDEVYWATAAQAMQRAAESLGMQFEVRFAERDHLRQLDLVREFASRPPATRPQYLVLVNETAGEDWLDPDWFRFGASTLLNDLLLQRQKLATGAYSGPDYVTLD